MSKVNPRSLARVPAVLLVLLAALGCTQPARQVATWCNPLDVNYRFQPTGQTAYREAADPALTLYRDTYFMYVSHSGGYWYSADLLKWNFVANTTLPIEDYAPDVITIGDTTYFIASASVPKPIYYTTDPYADRWQPLGDPLPFAVWDPHFFRDDDGRVYLYWGCSDRTPIYVVELDDAMRPVTDPQVVIAHHPELYGWENPGEQNEIAKNGYNEGPWMTKYKGRYYLQYASPGTEYKTYADGVYVGDSPMGPFSYLDYSPFSYKPGGFICGAGHSSTAQDRYGNYWHVATMSISRRHMFERRIGLFPTYFDRDGVMRTLTAFGDYPMVMPDHQVDFERESLFAGWMLLSYGKPAEASSTLEGYPVTNAVDEEVRTWWSASSGKAGEWFSVDLGHEAAVHAVQLNFADQDATCQPGQTIRYAFRLLASDDGGQWRLIADRSLTPADACHAYVALDKPVKARFLKVENGSDIEAKFSLYGFRIFGLKKGDKPAPVAGWMAARNPEDPRRATITWPKDPTATGYVVNYGTRPDKLYSSFMVYDANEVQLTGLNRDATYYLSIDAFNESGITPGDAASPMH